MAEKDERLKQTLEQLNSQKKSLQDALKANKTSEASLNKKIKQLTRSLEQANTKAKKQAALQANNNNNNADASNSNAGATMSSQ